jgi:integrase
VARRHGTGIYPDAYGFEIRVKRGGRVHVERAPRGTSDVDLQLQRARLLTRVLETDPHAAPKGTLTKAVATYIKLAKHLAGWKKQQSHLRAFLKAWPQKERTQITRPDVLQVRSDWAAAGVKPKTINNRLSALRALYHALDGADAPTPADRIPPLPSHRTPPQFITADLIAKVDLELQRQEQRGYLHTPKTRARFRVLATTGARPSEVMRAQPHDLDFDQKVWRVRDGKGGVRPMGVPLTGDAIHAWQLFIAADAWGAWNTNSFARTLRQSGWPKDVRPYQLRHTIGLALSDQDVDLADIGTILGHRPGSRMTAQHYITPQFRRMQTAMARLEGRLSWSPLLPGSTTRKRWSR